MRSNPKQLSAKHQALTSEYLCNVSEDDYAAFESKKELLQKISEVENQAISVYDMHRKSYLFYRTKFNMELDNMLDKWLNELSPSFFINLLHPNDTSFVRHAQVATFDFLNNQPPQERKDYKMVLDLTLVHPKGYFYRVVLQSVILELDKDGKIWLVMNIIEMISKNSSYTLPQCQLIDTKNGKQIALPGFNAENSVALTNREKEILKLLAQGLESKDIAQKLFISLNTVNNHRQNIINKTGTENMGQALLYAKRIGTI